MPREFPSSFPTLHLPIHKELVPSPLQAVKSLAGNTTFHFTATESTISDYDASPDRPNAAVFDTKPAGALYATVEHKDWPFYRCTLCLHFLSPGAKPAIIPGEPGRIFCRLCFIWIYKVSLCWKCRNVIGRGDERVGFGWCWWHWECMGCLCCAMPMEPPRWTGGPKYAQLQMPPLCSWCSEDENFVNPDGGMRDVGWKWKDKKNEDMMFERQNSLRVEASSATDYTTRPISVRQLPKWMSEAPASRVSNPLRNAGRGKDFDFAMPDLEGPLHVPGSMPLPAEIIYQAAKLRPLPKWMAISRAYRVTKPQAIGSDRQQLRKIPERKSSRGVVKNKDVW